MTKLYVVATPIGNLEDVSLRAKKILQQVDWIAAEDTRHSRKLCQHLNIDTPLFAYHQHNEQAMSESFCKRLHNGQSGAIITDAGTPCISDPGFYLVNAARQEGFDVIAVPGPSSMVAALSISGLPLQSFRFVGFLPAKSNARCTQLTHLSHVNETLVFFEAPHRIVDMIHDCKEAFGEVRQAFIAREITKQYEQSLQQSLGELCDAFDNGVVPVKGEFVVVIAGAPIVDMDLQDNHQELDRVLIPLLAHLHLKEAVKLASEITGQKKNRIYERALELRS